MPNSLSGNPPSRRKRRAADESSPIASKQPRSGRRSRLGCGTCKKKHVKCDESRPVCQTCIDKGWVCEGYASGVKWSYKHQPAPVASPDEGSFSFRAQPSSSSARKDKHPAEATQQAFSDTFDACIIDQEFPIQDGAYDATSGQFPGMDTPLAPAEWTGWPHATWTNPDVISNAASSTPRGSFSSQRSAGTVIDRDLGLGLRLMEIPYPYLDDGPHTAMELVRRWFDEVCPKWSGFDSDSNMNRKLAGSLWQDSEAVYTSLQSMTASFVTSRMPRMRQPALRLLRSAVASVQADIASNSGLQIIPTTTLFSLICIGTSVCWLDSGRVGSPFLRQATKLFQGISQQAFLMTDEQLRMLRYFERSLTYWDMLVSVVSDGDSEVPVGMGDHNMILAGVSEDSIAALPHPWTGISSLYSQLFGKAMRLCRVYRQGITNPTGRASSLLTAMQRIDEARRLEEAILNLDFADEAARISDTGDSRTPRLHLVQVAEAYQLAALLQLYITFPDLVSLRLPHEIRNNSEDVPWNKWITPLALQLVNVLENIPPDSGSRMMQPLLYICAGAGLRRDPSSEIANVSVIDPRLIRPATPLGLRNGHSDMMDYVDQLDIENEEDGDDMQRQNSAMGVEEARGFIKTRLDHLKHTLQPNPIVVAAELLTAVWAAYDAESTGSTAVHWVDVMERTGLRSLFG